MQLYHYPDDFDNDSGKIEMNSEICWVNHEKQN